MVKKIIRLTESDLTKLVSRVIKEQSKGFNTIASCASMGVKSPGQCDTQGKKPVKSCASLGVKTPGYCYVDTKKLVPNMAPKGKGSIKEQLNPNYSSGNILSGSSQKAVKQVFDSCGYQAPSPYNTNKIVDGIYRAVQGLGTDEASIIRALTDTRNLNTFCSAVKNYKTTYGTDLYSDLDGDIDEETVWAQISRVLRGLQQAPVAKPTTTGTTPQKPGMKPTQGGAASRPMGGAKPTQGGVPQKPMGAAKPTGGAPLTPQQIQQNKLKAQRAQGISPNQVRR